MKRVLLTVAFDGTAYHGWQVQSNGISVQSTIQKALKDVIGSDVSVTGCSRTDAGVHAENFCFHIDCDESLPHSAFLKGLNSVLPDDIKVIDCTDVENDFHARYNAKGKTYIYRFYTGIPSPFKERYFLHLESTPDVDLMNEFCSYVVGEHDFCGFSSSKRTVTDTVRTVSECSVYTENENIYFKVTANGFLYNMVRILAGTALFVGMGKLNSDCALSVFETKDRTKAGITLPAKALFLNKVYY